MSRTGYTGEDGFELYVDVGRRAGPLGRAPRGRRGRRPDPVRPRRARHAAPRGGAAPLRPGHGRQHRPVQLRARLDGQAPEGRLHRQRRAGQARSQASAAAIRRHRAPGQGDRPPRSAGARRGRAPPARSPAGPTASRSTTRSPPHHWTASVPADAELSVDIRGTAAAATVVPLPFYRRPKGA